MATRRFVIIVAGGKGLRMGKELPKQFIAISGKPILMHTLNKFKNDTELILVLPKTQIDYWKTLCQEYDFTIQHSIVIGGSTRYDSVLAGLQHISNTHKVTKEDLVAVHDGVRPLISKSCIESCFNLAQKDNAAIPFLPMTDSIRRIKSDNNSQSVKREEYIRIQTPQVFRLNMLLSAYQLGYKPHFTDDASVWEEAGYPPPSLVLSNEENIKITNPIDLHLADFLLNQKSHESDV